MQYRLLKSRLLVYSIPDSFLVSGVIVVVYNTKKVAVEAVFFLVYI